MDGDALTQGGDQVPPPPGLDYQASPPNALSTPQAGPQVPPPPGLEQPQQQAPEQQQLQPASDENLFDTAFDKTGRLMGPLTRMGKGLVDYGLQRNTQDAAMFTGAKETLTGNLLPANKEYEERLSDTNPYSKLAGNAAGFIGLMMPGVSAPAALAGLGWKGRLLWQSLIGAGQGGWLGFANGEGGLTSRTKDAVTGTLAGGVLGAAAGAAGEGIAAGVNKAFGKPIEGAARQAIEDVGLSATKAGPEQQAGIREALGAIGNPQRDVGAETALERTGTSQIKDFADLMHDQGHDLLRASADAGALLSADGVASVAQNAMEDVWRDAKIGVGDIPNYKFGAQAFDIVKQLAMKAQNSYTGQVPLTDILNAQERIGWMYRQGGADDRVYQAVRTSLNNWFKESVNSTIMSGNAPQAIQDALAGKQMYTNWHEFIDPKNMLGMVFKKALSGDQTANWLNQVTNLGAGQKAVDLAQNLKPVLGPDEWQALGTTMYGKAMDIRPEAKLNPTQVGARLDKLLNAPVSRVLYSPEDIALMQKTALALRSVPPNTPFAQKLASNLFEGALAAVAGTTQGVAEMQEHGDPWVSMKEALNTAFKTFVAEKVLHRAMPPIARGIAPTVRNTLAPAALSAYYNVPTINQVVGGQQKKTGGAISRAVSAAQRAARPLYR